MTVASVGLSPAITCACGNRKLYRNPVCAACALTCQPRYPVAPLVEALKVERRVVPYLVGVSGQLFNLYAEHGLPEFLADRWACRVGLHPSEVWPEWWPPEVRLAGIFMRLREAARA